MVFQFSLCSMSHQSSKHTVLDVTCEHCCTTNCMAIIGSTLWIRLHWSMHPDYAWAVLDLLTGYHCVFCLFVQVKRSFLSFHRTELSIPKARLLHWHVPQRQMILLNGLLFKLLSCPHCLPTRSQVRESFPTASTQGWGSTSPPRVKLIHWRLTTYKWRTLAFILAQKRMVDKAQFNSSCKKVSVRLYSRVELSRHL